MMERLEMSVTDNALEMQLSTETLQRSLFSSGWWMLLLRPFISGRVVSVTFLLRNTEFWRGFCVLLVFVSF